MEQGDLALGTRVRTIVVLEGVLATITPLYQQRRLRAPRLIGHGLSWHNTPLKRIATMKRTYPEVAVDVVTFTSAQVCEDAAEFFLYAHIPVDVVEHAIFDKWVALLPYQADVQVVYDSDQDRLDRYGQLGRSVVPGEDFM